MAAVSIRVVTWNVLADAYVRRDYYPHTPPSVFVPDRRRRAVVDRLATFEAADVICLQECDTALFDLAQATLSGSTGRLLRKPGREEGCAIFVRRASGPKPAWGELAFSDGSGHVALAVAFAGVTVVSTHLKWEPPGTAIDAHRGRNQLREILDQWPSAPRVVCGDFNAELDSEVLALAASRGLQDAYAALPHAHTCNANARKRRIDFILHSPDLAAVPSPVAAIDDDTPLPSTTEPSDHLVIDARLHRR